MATLLNRCQWQSANVGAGDFVFASDLDEALTPAQAGAVDAGQYNWIAENPAPGAEGEWAYGEDGVWTEATLTLSRGSNVTLAPGFSGNFSAAPRVRMGAPLASSFVAGSGDMLAATYDPQNIADDAFARANHTGTQTLSTISDAGTMAAEDAGDYYTSAQVDAGFQPLDSDLTAIAALSTTAYGRGLLALANAAALAAEVDAFFLTPAEGNAAYQPLDGDLTAIAALTTTAYGRSLLELADETALEALLDTLPNLTSIQGRTVTLADAGADAIFGWDDSAGAYQNLSGADALAALGVTATAAELNFVDGVTSAVQTQLNAKAPSDGATLINAVSLEFAATTEAPFLIDLANGDGNFEYGLGRADADKTWSGAAALSAHIDTAKVFHWFSSGWEKLMELTGGDGDLRIKGDFVLGGTVDGRDIATDGTKLDGVESGADVTDEANVKAALDGATLSDVGTPASGDRVLLQDASDSNNLKYAEFSEFSGGGGGTPGAWELIDDGLITSGTAFLDIALPSGYSSYRLTLAEVVVDADDDLAMAFSADGGDTFYNNTMSEDTYQFLQQSADGTTNGPSSAPLGLLRILGGGI